MNFEDLRKFIHLARSQNIQICANELNLTSGALSKTLKKIESALNTELFNRTGRNIVLNNQGKKFHQYASQLVHDYDQMFSEFSHNNTSPIVNLVGPSVLLNHATGNLLAKIESANLTCHMTSMFEGQAIEEVLNGKAHIAIVTQEALSVDSQTQLESTPIGFTHFRLVMGINHTLSNRKPLELAELLKQPFVCPATSVFCGLERGVGSDSWPDKIHPRKIRYRTDDFSSLLSIVERGQALAYIPALAIDKNRMIDITPSNFEHGNKEEYFLVYRPSFAHGWLNQLMMNVKKVNTL